MSTTIPPEESASAIWGRAVRPDEGDLPPEVARALLNFDFSREDRDRADWLSQRATEGSWATDERAELEEYVRVNHELMVLHSKARLSLRAPGLNAP
jgi:hypothetical protein